MIRRAKQSDSAAITALSAVLGYIISEADVIKNLTRLLPDRSHEFFVYEKENQVLGFIEAETYEAVYSPEVMLNVLGLVVSEAVQGQGIGGHLLQALEERARERNIQAIRLNSGVQRHAAHHFYEQHGYTSNHSQKRFIKML